MSLATKQFWTDAGERAIRTVAQTALSLLLVTGVDISVLASTAFWGASVLAGIISVLTSIVASNVGDKDNASLVPGETN